MEERRHIGGRPLLGEILLQRELITREDLERALRVQVGGMRRLGHVLIRMRCISDLHLMEALSRQLSIPIANVEEEFRPEVRALLPRSLCRRYGVLPLAREERNVLRLAMVDPLDDVAIRDVENYTGLAVRPVLASLRDIQRAVGTKVAWSRYDLFNPQVYRRAALAAGAAALVLLTITGLLLLRELRAQKYGTVSRVGGSVIYKNHDLMVDLAPDGTVYLSGRGAFAEGYFGVRFENPAVLAAFVGSQSTLLSEDQREWMRWLLAERLHAAAAPAAGPGG